MILQLVAWQGVKLVAWHKAKTFARVVVGFDAYVVCMRTQRLGTSIRVCFCNALCNTLYKGILAGTLHGPGTNGSCQLHLWPESCC